MCRMVSPVVPLLREGVGVGGRGIRSFDTTGVVVDVGDRGASGALVEVLSVQSASHAIMSSSAVMGPLETGTVPEQFESASGAIGSKPGEGAESSSAGGRSSYCGILSEPEQFKSPSTSIISI